MPQPRKRSGAGVERGILIHRILQHLPELAEDQRQAHIEAAVRRAGADPALAAAAHRPARPSGAGGHPLGATAIRRPPSSSRAPTARLERRRLDRLVITPEGILVADYKTDREVPESPKPAIPDYLMQLAIYRDALRLAEPGKPLRFCLLWTEGPKLMEIPDTLLDRMAALRPPRP